MTKIINIHTGKEVEVEKTPEFECNVCRCKFTKEEGGVVGGSIGIIPVNFCPTCFSGIFSMVDYFRGEKEDE